MSQTHLQPALQQRTLSLYGELLCVRGEWGGKLVIAGYPGAAWSGVAAATSLVGAASLVIDSDLPGMKTQFRDGAFDFIVNTLDEALRAIKNEVRQGRPVAIGLMADPTEVLAEAADRGLAASLLLVEPGGEPETYAGVCEAGARVVRAGEESAELREWLRRRGWSGAAIAAGDVSRFVAGLAEWDVRGRWLQQLPEHQRTVRGGAGSVWMTESERAAFTTESR